MLTKIKKLIPKFKALRQIDGLLAKVEELEARLSVVEGRSSINAERVVRAHASVQNLAEDVAGYHPAPENSEPANDLQDNSAEEDSAEAEAP